MVIDSYFVTDIESGIKATVLIAIQATVANGTANIEHIRGILDHAMAQATLYHLDWYNMLDSIKSLARLDAHRDLLEKASRKTIDR